MFSTRVFCFYSQFSATLTSILQITVNNDGLLVILCIFGLQIAVQIYLTIFKNLHFLGLGCVVEHSGLHLIYMEEEESKHFKVMGKVCLALLTWQFIMAGPSGHLAKEAQKMVL